jgi:hypothetical protein
MHSQLHQSTPGVQKPAKSDPVLAEGIAAMGKPIPPFRKERAYEQCLLMGLDKEMAMRCVDAMSEQLERDNPYQAQAQGMRFLDVTGMYRCMAYLLCGEES